MSSNVLLAMGDALYGVLAFDATLLSLAPGGVHADLPPNPSGWPLVWFELQQDKDEGAYGGHPGRKNRPGVNARFHVFQSEGGSLRASQMVVARLIDLLWNDAAPLTVDGYEVKFGGKPAPDAQTFQFADQELRGFKVKETVLMTDYALRKAA